MNLFLISCATFALTLWNLTSAAFQMHIIADFLALLTGLHFSFYRSDLLGVFANMYKFVEIFLYFGSYP